MWKTLSESGNRERRPIAKAIGFSMILFLIGQLAWTLQNPAAAYCAALGYQYRVTTAQDGGERGECVLPDGKAVDAWQFLRGEIGQGYSYCARKGLPIERVNDPKTCIRFMTSSCAVCVSGKHKKVEVTEMMGLRLEEDLCFDGRCVPVHVEPR